jgi:hypothetical protein
MLGEKQMNCGDYEVGKIELEIVCANALGFPKKNSIKIGTIRRRAVENHGINQPGQMSGGICSCGGAG